MEPASSLGSIGKYQLIASLRQGGTSRVYLALMPTAAGFTRLMVIKVVRDDAASDGMRSFLDAARWATRLVHPNIVHTYGFGEVDGQPFVAMEYLDGQTLHAVRERAAASGGLLLTDELRILAEAARGLHHAHGVTDSRGEPLALVHRAIDPRSVFITYDGQVKLLGFGLDARQATAADAHDRHVDVHGLGAMLWEAVTGEPLDRLRADAEHALRALRPDLPEALASIVDRATATRPQDGFSDAAAFASAVDALLSTCGEPPSAKSLSQHMSALFSAERHAMQALIERQVQSRESEAVTLGEATGNLPRVGGSDAPMTRRPRTRAPRSLSRELSLMALAGAARAAPSPVRVPPWSALLLAALLGAGAASLARESSASGAQLVPTLDAILASAPAALTRSTAEPAANPAGAQPMQQPRPAATVRVVLRALPRAARATLDGAPLTMPFAGEFPSSATARMLEVTADGYRPYRRILTLDRDAELEVELLARPLPRAGRRSPPAGLPAASPRSPSRQPPDGALTPEAGGGFDHAAPYVTQS